MKKIIIGLSFIATSLCAGEHKRFGYLLKEPLVDVEFFYTRKDHPRTDSYKPQDVFFSDSEWTAKIEYPTKYGPMVISKIKASILEGFNKQNYAPAEYTVTSRDLQQLKEGLSRFVIEANPYKKRLEISIEDKKLAPEKEQKDVVSKMSDGG